MEKQHGDINDFEQDWRWDGAVDGMCDPGVLHDPSKIMQRNAAFLLESSQKIQGYDEMVLFQMTNSYKLGDYARVIELAYQNDRVHRRSRNPFSSTCTPLTRVREFVASIVSLLN